MNFPHPDWTAPPQSPAVLQTQLASISSVVPWHVGAEVIVSLGDFDGQPITSAHTTSAPQACLRCAFIHPPERRTTSLLVSEE
jgi:hypothetical protein